MFLHRAFNDPMNDSSNIPPSGSSSGRTLISAIILALPYALAAIALAWVNPEGRLHPHYVLKNLGRGLDGEWSAPWLHLHALGIFAVTLLVAEALGRIVHIREIEVRVLAGYALTGLLMFGLGLIGMYHDGVFWGMTGVLIGIRWGLEIANRKKIKIGECISAENRNRCWPWIVYGLLLLPLIGYALTPPIQSDGIRYHLAALQEYLKAGGLTYLPFNAFSNLPFLVEMIFLLPMGLGSDTAAHLVHFSFLVLAAELAVRMAREMGQGGEAQFSPMAAAFLVRLAFLSFPVVMIVAAWPFVDAALMAFFLAMLMMLFRWLRRPDDRSALYLCGLFAGACLATKYTMVVFAGIVSMMIMAVTWHQSAGFRNRAILKPLIFFFLIMAAVASPWYVKNLINTGNPVYPLANGIFKGGEWGEASQTLYAAKAGSKGLKSAVGFVGGPILSTLSWTRAPGKQWPDWLARLNYEDQHPGVLYLMMAPIALGVGIIYLGRRIWKTKGVVWWRDSFVLLFVFGILYYLFWFFTYQSNRFLLPMFGLLVVFMIAAISSLFENRFTRYYVSALIALSFVYGYIWSLEWMYARTRIAPLPYLVGLQSREDYIAAALPHTQGFRALEGLCEPGDKTLFVGEYRGYYCRVPYIANDFFDQPVILDYLRRATLNTNQLREELRQDGIRYVYLNWAELSLYMNDFRRFFSPEEWSAFERFLNAPWLAKAWEAEPGFIIYEINPQ